MESIRILTRKGATCSDLLSCLYGLKQTEIEVFFEVVRRGTATVDELSEALERDRTTTHRCLSKLSSAGLVYRRTLSLKGGGYYHTYAAEELEKIKEDAGLRVNEVTESLQKLVEGFEMDFRKRLGEDRGAIH